jgi:hypothetical protein
VTSTPDPEIVLATVAAEIEAHVGQNGWDRAPTLFALVYTDQLLADEPETARSLGIESGSLLTPVEQDGLPEGNLDEVLAQIGWPESVVGCAVSQEIVLLPPGAEGDLPDDASAAEMAANHPERRDARLVVTVMRGGARSAVLRLRSLDGTDELLTGPELAPNLADALLATLD